MLISLSSANPFLVSFNGVVDPPPSQKEWRQKSPGELINSLRAFVMSAVKCWRGSSFTSGVANKVLYEFVAAVKLATLIDELVM